MLPCTWPAAKSGLTRRPASCTASRQSVRIAVQDVHIGRPVFWGLLVDGEKGVMSVLEMLRDELDATMGMCGRMTVESIDRDCLVAVSPLLALFPHASAFR